MQLLIDISDSLLDVLHQLPDEYYTKQLNILENQTIGQQVRHVVEHWQILADNYETNIINYANRKRDFRIENNKHLAIDLILQLKDLSDRKNEIVSVASLDEKSTFTSTYLRELDNVAEHLIHHAAIIKIAILSLDNNYKFPENFGYAPATVSYKQEQCAL